MKTNLLLALIAFSLLLSAALDRRATPQPRDVAKTDAASEPLFSMPLNDVEAIRVRDDRRCIVLQATAPAFPQLLDLFTKTRILRRFPSVAVELTPYGLARPDRQLAVRRRGETRLQTLLIGDLNPVSNAVYAKTEEESNILLVGGYFLTVFDFALQQAPTPSDPACTESFDKTDKE